MSGRYMHPTLANDLAETVSFYLGKPVEACLKFGRGLRRETVRGPRVLFTLTDNRKMWVDPPVADKIEATVSAGEVFWICKRKSPGNSQVEVYDVWSGNRDRSQPAAQMEPPEEWENGADDIENSGREENGSRTPAPAPIRVSNAMDTSHATPDPPRTQLEAALEVAVQACYRAQEYAVKIGYTSMPLFTGEDIRAMANCLLINKERHGADAPGQFGVTSNRRDVK